MTTNKTPPELAVELRERLGEGEFFVNGDSFDLIWRPGPQPRNYGGDDKIVARMACGETSHWLPSVVAQMLNTTLDDTPIVGEGVVERVREAIMCEIEAQDGFVADSEPLALAAIAALSSLPMVSRDAVIEEWQPIESAPLRTPIMLWTECVESGEGWRKEGELIADDPHCLIDEEDRTYWPHENGGYFTHWRPLPEPPRALSLQPKTGGDEG